MYSKGWKVKGLNVLSLKSVCSYQKKQNLSQNWLIVLGLCNVSVFSSVSEDMHNYEKVGFQEMEVVNSVDSETKLPAAETWLCLIQAVWSCGS